MKAEKLYLAFCVVEKILKGGVRIFVFIKCGVGGDGDDRSRR